MKSISIIIPIFSTNSQSAHICEIPVLFFVYNDVHAFQYKESNMTIRALILDFDGVLWHDTQPVGNVSEIFSIIKKRGLKVVIVTNNATRKIDQYLNEFHKVGLVLKPWQIINSAIATSLYLKNKFPHGGAVYIVGEIGIRHYIKQQGFIESEENVIAVIGSLDREINYQKIHKAATFVRNGALFLGTNPDETYLTPNGLAPAAGVILAAIETASGVKPIIMGKPEKEIFLQALSRLGSLPEETLVIGDRLDTDIIGGIKAGCKTGLVYTGVTTAEQYENSEIEPDFVAQNLSELLKDI